MAKLSVGAAVLEEIYYSGNIQANGRKLEYEDFLQFLIIHAGAILRLQFYEQMQLDGDASGFLSEMLECKMFDVKRKNGMSFVEQDIFTTPRNMGIFAVYPIVEGCKEGEEEPDYERKFLKVKTGEEWFYSKSRREDLGIDTFGMRGTKPLLGTEQDRVFIEGIFSDNEDLEMPNSVMMLAMSEVLTKVLRVPGYVDVTDDGNPNIPQLRSKLSNK